MTPQGHMTSEIKSAESVIDRAKRSELWTLAGLLFMKLQLLKDSIWGHMTPQGDKTLGGSPMALVIVRWSWLPNLYWYSYNL